MFSSKGKNNLIVALLTIILININCSMQALENAKYEDNIRNETKPPNSIRSKTDIWDQIEPVTYELKKIYETSFKAFKRPKGEIKVRFAINSHGKIINFEILNSSFQNTEFEVKIIDKLKSLKFPDISNISATDVTEVVFPFRFTE